MKKSLYEDIIDFNTSIIGLPKPDGEYKKLSPERLDWFKKCIAEEMGEFLEAWGKPDVYQNDEFDAIIDLVYFALGRLVEMGITKQQFYHMWDQVQHANMQKQLGNKGRGSDMDAIKPEGWKEPKF